MSTEDDSLLSRAARNIAAELLREAHDELKRQGKEDAEANQILSDAVSRIAAMPVKVSHE